MIRLINWAISAWKAKVSTSPPSSISTSGADIFLDFLKGFEVKEKLLSSNHECSWAYRESTTTLYICTWLIQKILERSVHLASNNIAGVTTWQLRISDIRPRYMGTVRIWQPAARAYTLCRLPVSQEPEVTLT